MCIQEPLHIHFYLSLIPHFLSAPCNYFYFMSPPETDCNFVLNQAESRLHSLVSECERQQQKIRELEVKLADRSTKQSMLGSLQEELQTERTKLAAANMKVTASTTPVECIFNLVHLIGYDSCECGNILANLYDQARVINTLLLRPCHYFFIYLFIVFLLYL